MIVCALLDLSTYPMLDLSKQAPLGAATLVFNSLLAAVLLSEPFTVRGRPLRACWCGVGRGPR